MKSEDVSTARARVDENDVQKKWIIGIVILTFDVIAMSLFSSTKCLTHAGYLDADEMSHASLDAHNLSLPTHPITHVWLNSSEKALFTVKTRN